MADPHSPKLPAVDQISGGDLERVIQRAAELQWSQGDVPDSLDEAAVIHIAGEVGLEPRHVRQALAELRADALVPARAAETGLATRLFGSATFQESRVVPGNVSEILSVLGEYLTDRESLTCVRDRGGHQVWEPSQGLGSVLQRSLDFSGKRYELAKARKTGVFVEQLEEGRSLVTLSVDLTNERNSHAGGWLFGMSAGGLGVSLGLILGAGAPALLIVPLAATTVATVATFGTSKMFAARKARVELAVQGLLDRLERGTDLASDKPSLRKRIEDLFEDD
jgi:hypothetical protein